MANNVEYWSDEYAKEVTALEDAVAELEQEAEGEGGPELSRLLAVVEERQAQVKKAKKFFGLELRLVKDRQERASHDATGKQLEARASAASKAAKVIQEKVTKKSLFDGGKEDQGDPFDTRGKTNEELLGGASKIQDLTFESIARTRALIEDSKEVGTSTLEELARQRDQIRDIDQEVTNIDSKLVRAEKMVINFTRRLASDRLIQICSAVNIVIMLALILYVVITGKKLNNLGTSGSSGGGPANTLPPTTAPASAALSIRRLRGLLWEPPLHRSFR